MAINNSLVEVEIPNLKGVYVRPIAYQHFLNSASLIKGDTEKDREEYFDLVLNAYTICNKDGEQIFTPEEYKEFADKATLEVGVALKKAQNAVNSFDGLEEHTKKK